MPPLRMCFVVKTLHKINRINAATPAMSGGKQCRNSNYVKHLKL